MLINWFSLILILYLIISYVFLILIILNNKKSFYNCIIRKFNLIEVYGACVCLGVIIIPLWLCIKNE